jgi:MshEN domain
MSSLDSGFPPPPPHDGLQPAAAPDPLAPLPPLQPLESAQPEPAPEPFQPLQPLEASPVLAPQPVEPLQLQPVEPLRPLAELEPLQPTMPPPLPLVHAAGPAAESTPVVPAASPEEIANLGVPLGTLIFRAGLLTEEQLEDALQEGVRSGKRLGEVLVESGQLDERDLGRLLADQKGLRFVELSAVAPDPAATALLSAEKAHMFAALPVGFENGVLLVAVADPSNELVTENLRRALGSEPRLVVASRSDLHAAIDRQHGPVDEPGAESVTHTEAAHQQDAPQAEEPLVSAPEPVAAAPVVEPLQQDAPAAFVPAPVPTPVAPEPALFETPAPEPAAEEVVAPALQPVEAVSVAQPETNDYTTVAPLTAPEPEPEPEHVHLPEAASEPEPEPEHVHLPEAAPEPEAVQPEPVQLQPEPVVAEPVVEPVPVEPEPVEPVAAQPLVEAQPEPAPTFDRIEAEPVRESEPVAEELPSALSYDVSLRLTDGERVAIGSFGDPQKAREYARDVVKHLSDEEDGWPFFSGRYLRPDTIVSVDIVPVGEPDRWLGSSIRSNWASRLNR